jgi:Leucine-rich repeat (LRR) protein
MPSGLANLKDLEEISLEGYYYSENPLQGEALLSQIQQLTKLKKLELNNIKFTGPLPQGIGALTDLRELVLTHCELTGSIPSEIGNLRNLESLDFSDNKLSGSIPDGIWELKKLKNLILSENKLTGSLSEKIGQLRNLTILDISSNKMSGDLPTQAFLDHPSLDKFQENNGFCHLRQGPSWIYEDETNNDSTFTNEESFTKSTLINILPIRHVINRAMQAEPDR